MMKLCKIFLVVALVTNQVICGNVRLSESLEGTGSSSSDVLKKIDVTVQLEEIWATENHAAQLFCQYTISTGEDLPVTVTWKVGDGPRFATEVLKCSGYTNSAKTCVSEEIMDNTFSNRVRIAQSSPSMEITKVDKTDNRNFWCQVTLDDAEELEAGFDMKSVVLRIFNGGNNPKFHSVAVTDDIVTKTEKNVTIKCICARGYHCNDVFWYKGPIDSSLSNYDVIYSRTSHSRPIPTQYQAHGQWIDRVYLSGDSLVITDLKMADSGRYWCEMRSSAFYAVGEWATDAKSVFLEVGNTEITQPFDCLGKPDGLYPDPEDCTKYFECANSIAHSRQCGHGTIYNPAAHPYFPCDYESNVEPPCGTKTSIN